MHCRKAVILTNCCIYRLYRRPRMVSMPSTSARCASHTRFTWRSNRPCRHPPVPHMRRSRLLQVTVSRVHLDSVVWTMVWNYPHRTSTFLVNSQVSRCSTMERHNLKGDCRLHVPSYSCNLSDSCSYPWERCFIPSFGFSFFDCWISVISVIGVVFWKILWSSLS